jgi:hypothetical protein
MQVVILICILSYVFIGVGCLITEKNAPYLLKGYNTMSKEKQEQVDLKGLLRFSKRFHINLGVSQAIIGFTLYYLGYDKGLNLFLSTYSIIAYIYFIWKSAPFQPQQQIRSVYIGIAVLSICLLGILGSFFS